LLHFDRGLKLTKADLAVDFRRRQPRAFISHAHIDHMARHQYALCTPETARLYHLRLGRREVLEMPYRQTIDWGGLRLTTYPAGHCLGSAMLLAEDDGQTLLYTGDFKLGESATSEPAELPRADILVIESTYGEPQYRRIPRPEVIAQLIDVVRTALAQEATPVIQAYSLGKSQEVTRILTLAGIPVLQHPKVFEISRVYTACGVELGDHAVYAGRPLDGHAVVAPPFMHRPGHLPGLKRTVSIAVTGWAQDSRARFRLGVEQAIPLSDHADYDDLFKAVELVGARTIYCTHGPVSFVTRLREAGFNAFPLDGRAGDASHFDFKVQQVLAGF
jgi:putative mRNA 3-end processing factor